VDALQPAENELVAEVCDLVKNGRRMNFHEMTEDARIYCGS
jgi:hypothetical protein